MAALLLIWQGLTIQEFPIPSKMFRIVLACDVTNPLTGPEGAAHVFAPQKGATATQVELLDQGLANLAHVIMQYNGRDIECIPGTGAAGVPAAVRSACSTQQYGRESNLCSILRMVAKHAHGPTSSSPAKVLSTVKRHTAKCQAALQNWRNRKENQPLPSAER